MPLNTKFYFEHVQSSKVANSKKDTQQTLTVRLSLRAKLTDIKETGLYTTQTTCPEPKMAQLHAAFGTSGT